MTQKRKAELQRKLSMASVPRPPDGLVDRIKADIPDLRATKNERERSSRSVAFNMRVAASILLLVSSAFLALRILAPAREKGLASRANPETAMVTVTIEPQVNDAASDAAKPAGPFVQKLDAPSAANTVAPLQVATSEAKKDERIAERPERREMLEQSATANDAGVEGGVEGDVLGGVVGGAVGGVVAQVAPAPVPPPAMAPPPPPPPAAPLEAAVRGRNAKTTDAFVAAAPTARQSEADAITVTAESPAFMASARAADFSLAAAPASLFGVSLNHSEFGRLKAMVETKQRPDAASVDVEALVNHFAGVRATRDDVALQVEASQPPLPGGRGLLRITIDTAAAPRGGSLPPAATAATLEIDVKSDAIDRYTMIGGGTLASTEPLLVKGSSVTRLMELTVNPQTKPSQVVATVLLRYGSIRTGKTVTIRKNVLARDVRRTWTAASRRHRLATLGAVWGQSFTEAGSAEDVAVTAEKLSKEQPDDERAKELATAASASSRLRSSGPTGSGR